MFCQNCGASVADGTKFCPKCGTRLVPAAASSTRQAPASRAGSARAEAARQAADIPRFRELTASASAGEVDFGELALPGLSELTEPVAQTLSPVSGLFHGVGSLLRGVAGLFKKPSTLIGTVLLAALWYVLARYRDSDSEIVKILSWLTYAKGGFDRSALGTVGGVLGKGTVAAALLSLFTGKAKDLFKGIGILFTGNGEKRGILSILLGVVLGGIIYFAFAGEYASADTAMAGIAGTLLSLEALGGGSGKLYELAQNLTSRAQNGVRTAVRGRCDGLLTGLTLGFTLATALSALGGMGGAL